MTAGTADGAVPALLREATARLTQAGVPSARHDAESLLAHVSGCGRGRLHDATIGATETARFHRLVEQRAARVPLQHLLGSVGFRYLELAVGPGVFVPRPETEVVVDAVVEAAGAVANPLVVDLCSGSGAIALSVAHEVPTATVHAVELDEGALEWLRLNATDRAEAGDAPVHVHAGDVEHAVPELDGTVDVVASNPPYVAADELPLVEPEVREHDPHRALVAGDDGLSVIRSVVRTGWRLLRSGGVIVVEHSDRQGESAPAVLREIGFVDVADHRDLADRDRFATGRRP
jgi:release factor glutamine methyltransferase